MPGTFISVWAGQLCPGKSRDGELIIVRRNGHGPQQLTEIARKGARAIARARVKKLTPEQQFEIAAKQLRLDYVGREAQKKRTPLRRGSMDPRAAAIVG